MSRVGNNPISVPEDVTIDVTENVISVKGKLGELQQDFSGVLIKIDNGIITVERVSESKENKSKHGLYRALNKQYDYRCIKRMDEGIRTCWCWVQS